MRKITIETTKAFLDGRNRTIGNTSTDGTVLKLHGNVIARKSSDGSIYATLAGWGSVTTRERLNGLCCLLGLGCMFGQRRFQQFYGDHPIETNEWVVLKEGSV